MSTLGISRSGRVRKKSAKVVEMEKFDGAENPPSENFNSSDNESPSRISPTSTPVPVKRVLTPNRRPSAQISDFNCSNLQEVSLSLCVSTSKCMCGSIPCDVCVSEAFHMSWEFNDPDSLAGNVVIARL